MGRHSCCLLSYCSYMAAMNKCKTAEGTIDRVTREVKDLKSLVEQKFDEVIKNNFYIVL